MKLKDAMVKFDKLSDEILKDGKVDWEETNRLLEFIEPYLMDDNKRFVEFKATIDKCREDGKITNEESELLARQILKIKRFLKVENVSANVFIGFMAALVGYGIVSILAEMILK